MHQVGTGFGLMSLSVLIADCVLLHCTKNKNIYQRIKELELNEKDVQEIELDEVEATEPVSPIRI
jgi:hypothetical protein